MTAKGKILVLIDWENLIISIKANFPGNFSLTAGINRLKKWIELEGEILGFFVFAPLHILKTYSDLFYKNGFIAICCPKVASEKRKEIDTTDEIIIIFGEKMIATMPELTHLCIASGDIGIKPLIEQATRKGLKIMIAAGHFDSLANELIDLASRSQSGKLIHMFDPKKS